MHVSVLIHLVHYSYSGFSRYEFKPYRYLKLHLWIHRSILCVCVCVSAHVWIRFQLHHIHHLRFSLALELDSLFRGKKKKKNREEFLDLLLFLCFNYSAFKSTLRPPVTAPMVRVLWYSSLQCLSLQDGALKKYEGRDSEVLMNIMPHKETISQTNGPFQGHKCQGKAGNLQLITTF